MKKIKWQMKWWNFMVVRKHKKLIITLYDSFDIIQSLFETFFYIKNEFWIGIKYLGIKNLSSLLK